MIWTQADIDAAKCRMGSVKESLTVRARFFVQGEPKPQPRVKACRTGAFTRMYTPKTADAWKKAVRVACIVAALEKPLQGALGLSVMFYLPRPQAHYHPKNSRHNGELRTDAPIYDTSKNDGDIDNLLKSTMDAMTESQRIWLDDSQVSIVGATKTYADSDREIGAMIEVSEL